MNNQSNPALLDKRLPLPIDILLYLCLGAALLWFSIVACFGCSLNDYWLSGHPVVATFLLFWGCWFGAMDVVRSTAARLRTWFGGSEPWPRALKAWAFAILLPFLLVAPSRWLNSPTRFVGAISLIVMVGWLAQLGLRRLASRTKHQ